MLLKQESSTSQKLDSCDFWRIANSILNKGKFTPLFKGAKVLSSESDIAKLFEENFSESTNVDDSGTPLPAI